MAVQFSVAVRNARLDAIETVIGTEPKLRILTGSQPATCATAESGSLLCEMDLPSDWAGAAAAGAKAKAGTWSGTASGAGTAGYYRIVDTAGTTCHEQGSIGEGSGDLSLDNTDITSGQTVTINTFTKTDGNA